MAARKILSLDAVRALAASAYAALGGGDAALAKLAPTIREISAKANRPATAPVAAEFYRLAGTDTPLPASAAKGPKSLAKAVAKRRDAGIRWEIVAASASATLGRRVGVAEAKELYRAAGKDLAASYTGRGTRVAAPATYADPLAAVAAATGDAAK